MTDNQHTIPASAKLKALKDVKRDLQYMVLPMCTLIRWKLNEIGLDLSFKELREEFNMNKYKPNDGKKYRSSDPWFPVNEEGRKKRLEIIDKMIEEQKQAKHEDAKK